MGSPEHEVSASVARPLDATEYEPLMPAFDAAMPASLVSIAPLVRLPAPSAVKAPAIANRPEPEAPLPPNAKPFVRVAFEYVAAACSASEPDPRLPVPVASSNSMTRPSGELPEVTGCIAKRKVVEPGALCRTMVPRPSLDML